MAELAEDDMDGPLRLGELDLTSSEPISLEGLERELAKYENHEVVRDILRSEGAELRERASAVEGKLHQVELDSIQDYVAESDNLVALQEQIRGCDGILGKMESLLGGFQSDLGKISSEIKSLQEQSFTMSIKLRNRKSAEAQLGQFVEDISLPPKLISAIVDGEVNDAYVQSLVQLHTKLEFIASEPKAQNAAALQDVESEVERLRVKAAAKARRLMRVARASPQVREFLLQRFYSLRKPKTNIQILQQNVLLKFKYFVKFLQQHCPEVFPEVRQAYVETLGRIYRSALSKYVIALNQLQVDAAGRLDLLGAEENRFHPQRARDAGPSKDRDSVFSLGARSTVMRDLDCTPPLIVHQAEAAGEKYPYEVLFRSAHKLLMDSATSEYLFCHDFWAGDQGIFREVFAPAIAAVDENLSQFLANCFDVGSIILMIRINHEHQVIMSRRRAPCLDTYLDKVNMMLWPRFKVVFDAHLASVRTASERALLTDDLQGHYIARRYAEFAASAHSLTAVNGDAQLDQNMERLRSAVCDLLVRVAKLIGQRKGQLVFLINNFEMILAVLREAAADADDPGAAGADRGAAAQFFGEQLGAKLHLLVEEELADQFNPLVTFVKRAETAYKRAEAEGAPRALLPQFGPEDAEPVLRDFSMSWKTSIEEIHRSIVASFGNSQRSLDILQRTLSQLLLFYTRLTGPEGVLAVYCGAAGAALCRDAVSTATILAEVKRMVQHRQT